MKHLIAAGLSLGLLFGLSGCTNASSSAMTSSPVESVAPHCLTAVVEGMTCEVCASTVTTNLKKIPGIEDTAVDVATGTVKIYTDGQPIDPAAVQHIVERSGYKFQSLQKTCN